jgi:hypothetical protein
VLELVNEKNVGANFQHWKKMKVGIRRCDECIEPGLPDGLFPNQNSQFGLMLEGFAMKNLGIFYDHFVYFTAIGNIL